MHTALLKSSRQRRDRLGTGRHRSFQPGIPYRRLAYELLEHRRLLSGNHEYGEPADYLTHAAAGLVEADLDFGDAPSPYPTTVSADGARHVAAGPTLGASRDTESDGQPTASADGDDTTGTPDDEDGVTFGSPIRVGQLDASVTVNAQNAPSGAKLDAWIDFNAHGSWGGAFERVADSVDVTAGDNTLLFDVPSWAAAGYTYARFRLSTAGNLAPSGAAADGEVEDYTVTIHTTVVAPHVFYNNSAFDGNDPAVNAQDHDPIAPLKEALIPGGTATEVNYTCFSKGINGIMIDVTSLPGTPGAGDFVFRAHFGGQGGTQDEGQPFWMSNLSQVDSSELFHRTIRVRADPPPRFGTARRADALECGRVAVR